MYSSFLGGLIADSANGKGVVVDRAGQAYVVGYTNSPNFPTSKKAPQRTFGGGLDGFLTKISSADEDGKNEKDSKGDKGDKDGKDDSDHGDNRNNNDDHATGGGKSLLSGCPLCGSVLRLPERKR